MAPRYDDDEPDEDDDEAWAADEGDDDPTMACPHCGAELYDDAVYCPACDRYLSDEERTTTNRPIWVVATAVVLLVVIAWAYLF